MREWLSRLMDWFRRDKLEAELRDEINFHHSSLERDAHDTDPVMVAIVASSVPAFRATRADPNSTLRAE